MENKADLIILEDNSADQQDQNIILDENTIILAAGDTYSLIDMDALEKAVDASGLSYQDISRKADISISSIYKFFSRTSKNPTFYNVLMIFKVIGASVDTLCGLKPKAKPTPTDALKEKIIRMEDQIKTMEYKLEVKDTHIADLERQKSDAEILRDRYKEHFMAEIEKERTRYAAELDQERKRCDSELIRRDQQHEEEKKIIRRRGTVRFVLAMSLAGLSTLLFGLYIGADMILSGDYALLRQLFQ